MRSSLRSAAEEAEADAVGLSTEVEEVVVEAAEDEVEAAAGCCCCC